MARLPDTHDRRPVGNGVRPVATIGSAGAVGAAWAGAGRSLQGAGEALSRVAERERQEETAARAGEGDVFASARIRQILFDPEAGFLNTIGQEAVRRRQKTVESLTALRDKVLTNADARVAARLRPVLNDRIDLALRQIDTHTSSERKAWLTNASDARLSAARDDAVANYATPEVVDKFLNVMTGELRNRAEREGWSPEEYQQKVDERTRDVLTAAVYARSAHDPVGALDYARANASRLGPAMGEIELRLNDKAKEHEGRAWGVAAMGSHADPLAAAMELSDPKMRDAAVSEIERRLRAEAAAEQRVRQAAQRDVWVAVEAGRDPRSLPVDVRANAGPEVVASLERYYDQKSTGFAPRTDPELYAELVKESQSDPAAFEKRELLAYRDKLSEQDYRSMTDAQAAVGRGDPLNATSYEEPRRVWRSVGIENGAPGTEMSKQYAQLELAYNREWQAFVEREKRQPTIPEQVEMAHLIATNSPLINSAQRLSRETLFTGSAPSLRSAAEPLMRAAGLEPNADAGSDKAKKVAAFHTLHQEAAQRFTETNGRQPTDVEAARMAERLLRPVRVDPWGLRNAADRFAFQITLDDLRAVQAGDMTLTVSGRPVTAAELQTAGRMLVINGNADPTIPELLAVIVGE